MYLPASVLGEERGDKPMASAPTTIDPSSSVLFLGSGFARDATSIRKKHVPTGGEFKSEVASLVGASAVDYDLKVLAEELASRSADTLYQLLYQSFTITDLSAGQKTILDNRWQRIYTTNYDDAVELAHKKKFTKYASYNYDDPKPKRVEPECCRSPPWEHSSANARQCARPAHPYGAVVRSSAVREIPMV
jgi:hypothetical protein